MEKYKEIPGYEGLYLAGTKGNIFSCRANKIMSPGFRKFGAKSKSGTILLPYRYVNLVDKKGKRKTYFVHRLILLVHEGPMPENCECVMHLNDDPADNRLRNLKYGTHSDNARMAFKKGRNKPNKFFHGKTGKSHWKSTPVIAIKNKTFLAEYESMRIAERETGIDICSIMNSIKDEREVFGVQFKKVS